MDSRQALDQISYMQQLLDDTRLCIADRYPYFILWGIIWVIGYGSNLFLTPEQGGLIWLPLVFIGMVVNSIVAKAQFVGEVNSPFSKRIMWLNIVSFSMLFLLPNITGIRSINAMNAFFPFFIGFIYILNGIFVGREMIIIGAWMMFTGVVALFLPLPVCYLWLAIAGGGGLITSGLLLRRQVKPNG